MDTIQSTYSPVIEKTVSRVPAWKKFIKWAEGQEENRFLWLAVALFGHGCILTIVTIFAIMLSGNSFILWPIAIASMAMCVITNLAALPTKITIPVFFFSVLIDVVIIAICIANGFNISNTYI
jgi:hypothetical protein